MAKACGKSDLRSQRMGDKFGNGVCTGKIQLAKLKYIASIFYRNTINIDIPKNILSMLEELLTV